MELCHAVHAPRQEERQLLPEDPADGEYSPGSCFPKSPSPRWRSHSPHCGLPAGYLSFQSISTDVRQIPVFLSQSRTCRSHTSRTRNRVRLVAKRKEANEKVSLILYVILPDSLSIGAFKQGADIQVLFDLRIIYQK